MNVNQLEQENLRLFEELKKLYGEEYTNEAMSMHDEYILNYFNIYNESSNVRTDIRELKHRYKKQINKLRKKYGLPIE